MNTHGDYEMANFVLSTYEEPTPTITPSSTPTPTLTPTPTPTPSPTPIPTLTPTPTLSVPKRIVVIPGMGGSWNKDALLKCKPDGYSGAWTPWLINGVSPYQSLLDSLTQAGFDPKLFTYDWRKSVSLNAPILKSYIQSNAGADTVHLVGHSMGGLVARKYLENETTENHLDKLLTVGTPHKGSVLAYPAWSGGEVWTNDTQIRLAATLLQIGCYITHRWSAQQTYRNLMPSIQNLLPTFNYLKDATGNLQPVTGMDAQNDWLPSTFASPFFGVTVGSLSGIGFETLNDIQVHPPNRSETRRGIWKDGKPTGINGYGDGDGTVLLTSSQLTDTYAMTLPLDHLSLVTHSTGIDTIIRFLKGETITSPLLQFTNQQKPSAPTKHTTALLIVVDGARATLKDKQNNSYTDEEGQITLLDPKEDIYTLTITPPKTHAWQWWRKWWKTKYKVIVVQLFEDGTSKWKEYNRYDLLRKRFKLRFDLHHKHEDILHDK